MILDGLPDFQGGLTLAGGPVWPAFRTRHWLAPPTSLVLAETNGLPSFRVSLTRSAAPFLPPPPYAALDLTLVATCDEAAALTALREAHPDAVLARAYPSTAFALLEPSPGAPELPPDLAGSFEPAWNGLGTARLLARLGIEAGTLVAGMVEDATLPIGVRMALGFDGVSPRLPVEARFDPAALLAGLVPHLPGSGLTIARLAGVLEQIASELPLRLSAGAFDDPNLAAALADRIAARFATLRPVPGAEPELVLPAPDAIDPGSFAWDLSVPMPARRWIDYSLDPFAAVRAYVSANGPELLVTRSVTMPIPAAQHTIWAFANLPRDRIGLEALGVTIRADGIPPNRPQPVVATRMIEQGGDTAELPLQLAPGEPLAYTAQGFAVIADALGVRRLDGAPRPCDGQVLRLLPEDFALFLLAVEASAGLLAEARVQGEVHYVHEGREHALAFGFSPGNLACVLALPAAAESCALTVTAYADDLALTLGPMPAQHTRVSLASFPGYGPQRVSVRCPPPVGSALVALDFVGGNRPDAEAETLAFTADRPEREWRYFSPSPFSAGFRWRLHTDTGNKPAPWHYEPSAGELAPLLPPRDEAEIRQST